MLETEIAYFAPNNFGYRGYAMIGPLLLFYKKLVISNPSGNLLNHALRDFPKTSLTEYEFKKYVLQGYIVPTGFGTFFDPIQRKQQYPDELQIGTELDEVIIGDPTVHNNRILLSDDFKSSKSSLAAVDLCKTHASLAPGLKYLFEHRPLEIPSRYAALNTDSEALPRSLRSRLGKDLKPADLFPYMFVYDQLNNQYAIEEFKKRVGTLAAFALHNEYHAPYQIVDRAFSKREESKKESSSNVILIGEVLKEAVARLQTPRLTAEQIDEFRETHRDSFISFVQNALKEVRDIEDPDRKREKIAEAINREFNRLQWHLSIGPDVLLNLAPQLVKLSLPNVTPLLYPKKLHKFLYQPLERSKRWLFHFLNPIP